ncbi:hypothetical protein F5050DRAFT_1723688, partial [Lentinula boryana]
MRSHSMLLFVTYSFMLAAVTAELVKVDNSSLYLQAPSVGLHGKCLAAVVAACRGSTITVNMRSGSNPKLKGRAHLLCSTGL